MYGKDCASSARIEDFKQYNMTCQSVNFQKKKKKNIWRKVPIFALIDIKRDDIGVQLENKVALVYRNNKIY